MDKVKFGRSEVQDVIQVGDVDLWIRGEYADGTPFQGMNTIKIKNL
jgi:hypothetical protein